MKQIGEATIFHCPRCQIRAIRNQYSGDFVHVCQGAEALKNEDVIVIGKWIDYTGSDSSVIRALMQGTENTLQFTRGGVEGDKFSPRTSRGFPKSRFRTRQHLEFIPKSKFKKRGISDTEPTEYMGEEGTE